jgi:aldose 1-epimerase
MQRIFLALGLLLLTTAGATAGPKIERVKFGTLPDGTEVDLYTLTNGNMVAKITNYGGIVTSLMVPDKNGRPVDVVLGFDNLKDYVDSSPYFGAIIGRVGNRIANAKFSLDGKEYKLDANNPPHSLHGGKKGFDKQVWKASPRIIKDNPKLTLSYVSKDGEEGYPGTLTVTVEYTLKDNALMIDYTAYTDKATPVNLTHHSYFNLSGHNAGEILNHDLMIFADKYTPGDKTLIPTGKIEPVEGTPLDFRMSTPIGKRLKDTGLDPVGYDHNYVLRGQKGLVEKAAEVSSPVTGIKMLVLTTEPGLQFYTGNFLGKEVGKGGSKYPKYGAFCLEAQHYPDSPNKPEFPSITLKPGQVYKQKTTYEFGMK